jgi:hypothetical protein
VLPKNGITEQKINKIKINLPIELSKPFIVVGIENILTSTHGRNTDIIPTSEKRKINFL